MFVSNITLSWSHSPEDKELRGYPDDDVLGMDFKFVLHTPPTTEGNEKVTPVLIAQPRISPYETTPLHLRTLQCSTQVHQDNGQRH